MFVQVYYSLWFCTYIRAEIANKYLVNLILAFSFHEKYISNQEFLHFICLGRNFKVHIYVVSARDPFLVEYAKISEFKNFYVEK